MKRLCLLCTLALFASAARAESGGPTEEEQARAQADRELRRKLSEAALKIQAQQAKWESDKSAPPPRQESAAKDTKAAKEARKAAEKAREQREKEEAETRERRERELNRERKEEGRKGSEKSEPATYGDSGYQEGDGRVSAHASAGPRDRVNFSGHSVPAARGDEGGWFEIGGVSRDVRYRSGNSGAGVGEGARSGTSIGVRATVIRLGDPEE